MTRDVFLGFGCSATTLLTDQFKINTFSVEEYCRRVSAGKLPTALTCRMTPRQRMVYYLFWTAYGMKIDPRNFEQFFGVPLKKMYWDQILDSPPQLFNGDVILRSIGWIRDLEKPMKIL